MPLHTALAQNEDSLDSLLDQETATSPEPNEEPDRKSEPTPESNQPEREESSERSEETTKVAETGAIRQIEEIVVTAQKKVERLEDVPISMEVLSGDFLQEAQIIEPHELARFAPNVDIEGGERLRRMFIRGIGNVFGSDGAFEPSVGLVVDELPFSQSAYLGSPMLVYDIERFEILRGPQGTLFGKNTSAGLLSVTTREPTKESTGYALGRIGTLGTHRVEAAIGGPLGLIGDVAQFRFALLANEKEGDVLNTKTGDHLPGIEQLAGRLKLALQPVSGLDILAIAERDRISGFQNSHQNQEFSDASLEWVQRFDPDFEDDPLNHQTSVEAPGETFDRNTRRLQGRIRYAGGSIGPVGNAEVVAVIGYSSFFEGRETEIDVTPASIFNIPRKVRSVSREDRGLGIPESLSDYDQRSVELRLSGFFEAPFGLGTIEFLGGYLLFDTNLVSDVPVVFGEDFSEYLFSPGGFRLLTGQEGAGFENFGAVADLLGVDPTIGADGLEGPILAIFSDQSSTANAIFGRTAWHLTDDFQLNLGVRLTFEERDALIVNTCFNDPACTAFGFDDFQARFDRQETDVSPRFGLQYSPFDNLTLFGVRARGFKSGGFNNISTEGPEGLEVDSESVVSWEIGAKGTLLGGVLSYGATLFDMDVDDLQLQEWQPGGVTIQVANAASASVRGLEWNLRWLTPLQGLRLRAAGSLTDGKFDSFPNAVATILQAESGQDSQDLSGRRLPFLSKYEFTMTPTLIFPLRTLVLPVLGTLPDTPLNLITALDLTFRSNRFLDTDLDPRTLEGAFTMMNGRIGLSSPGDTWSLVMSVKNLTDVEARDHVEDSTFFPPGVRSRQEYQRNFSLELRYEF